MIELDGKIALITGGASGLGEAIARRFIGAGAKVVITDIQNETGAAVAKQLKAAFLAHDVTNEDQWSEVVGKISSGYGRIDILVNNAGISGPLEAASPENTRLGDWKSVFAINVEGVFLGCKSVLPVMRATGAGSIINISSIAGLIATPYATAYGASKAAVRHLTKSVAQHCAHEKLGIRCNSVHPGNVRTPLWDKQAKDRAQRQNVDFSDILAEARALVPLGDFTQLEDVAAAVTFLASDEARHITGIELTVDGGITNCETYHFRSGAQQLIAREAAARTSRGDP